MAATVLLADLHALLAERGAELKRLQETPDAELCLGVVDQTRSTAEQLRLLGAEAARTLVQLRALYDGYCAAARRHDGLLDSRRGAPAAIPARSEVPPAPAGAAGRARLIPLAPGAPEAALPACPLPAAGGLPPLRPGVLYYHPGWEQFLLNVGGMVLRGAVGRVYPGRGGAPPRGAAALPEATRECNIPKCPGTGCSFYHDPASGTPPQRRNYVAADLVYRDRAAPGDLHCLAVDSADHLAQDLARLSPLQARLYVDRAMHQLLLALYLLRSGRCRPYT